MKYKEIEWVNYQGALIPATAPHTPVELSQAEEKELLKLSRAYFIRYVTDFDSKKESSFWFVIKDEKELLESYKSKVRNQIRKGLKHCQVKRVEKEEIKRKGYTIYKAAFESYETDMKLIPLALFQENILNSDMDFWAVYNAEGVMIAYSQNLIQDNSVTYSTVKIHPDYLKEYPSYALFCTMNAYYLNEKKFAYVNDGARSIAHSTNIQSFLISKFLFRKAYCTLHVVYRWDIALVVQLLYPLRTLIRKINHKVFKKLSILLKQEEIRRSFEK